MFPRPQTETSSRPVAVKRAAALMGCGALVQAFSTATTAMDRSAIRARTAHLAHQYKGRRLTGEDLEHATSQAYWFSIGTGVVCVLLWLIVARLCLTRRAVGRVIATILTIVYTFTFLVSGFASIGPGTVIGLVLASLGLAVVYFLWRKPVTSWFAARPETSRDQPD